MRGIGYAIDSERRLLRAPPIPSLAAANHGIWRRCRRCAHVFTEGYFTDEAAAIVFSKSLPHQTVGHDVEQARAVSARMVERVARHVKNGDWLDVGFGNASLLDAAKANPYWGEIEHYHNFGLRAQAVSADAPVCFQYSVAIPARSGKRK